LLLANKCDLAGVNIDTAALDKFVKDNGFIGWFPSSAANNTNIDEAMKFLIGKILEVAKTNVPKPEEDTLNLDELKKKEQTKPSACACMQEF